MSDFPLKAPRRTFALLRAALSVVLSAMLVACGDSSAPPAAARTGGSAVPVTAGKAEQKDMPVLLPGIGNVRAFAEVSVKPRVTGQVSKILFQEGQEVKEGDVLITLDPEPFEVALTQAKARLAQARSTVELAQARLTRGETLTKSGAVAQEEMDQLQNTLRLAQASIEVENAAVRGAELLLSYCTIRSPISGRTGRRVVDAGNVVKAEETELVTVYQLRPVQVVFSVPEQHLGDIMREMAAGPLPVTIRPGGSTAREARGKLTFVDNAVRATTGTIDLKAEFPNDDLTLWPGQFGEVTLTLSVQRDAVVIPSAAIQTGQQGAFVFVIKPDATVEVRPIKVARTLRDESVVRDGLKPGEVVVLDGQLRLTPGAKVTIKPPVGETATASPIAGKEDEGKSHVGVVR
jgi:multidrug efflux system membrane fusion protein